MGTGGKRRSVRWGAALIWSLPIVVIAVLTAINPRDRTVVPLYHDAASAWWDRGDLYSGPAGMNYLPHFAVLFSPFAAVPAPWGDVLWRVAAAAWLAWGMWRLTARLEIDDAAKGFLRASLLAVPLCLSAMRNGQANVAFAAATVHAVVLMMGSRWASATACLFLALAIKPLGAVLLLLAPWGYRPLWKRIIPGAVMFLMAPFLFAPTAYVISQYRAAAGNLGECSQVTENRFANLQGIGRKLGREIDGKAMAAAGILAGIATLGIWVVGARRATEPDRGLLLLTLSTSYLMLFNPMNESNSFVIAAPAMAGAAVWFASDRQDHLRKLAGWIAAAVTLSIGLLPEPLRSLSPDLSLWGKPAATLVFLAVVTCVVLAERGKEGREHGSCDVEFGDTGLRFNENSEEFSQARNAAA